MTVKATTNKFSPEVRERAVRMVLEHAGDYPRAGRPWCRLRPRSGARQRLHGWTKKAEVEGGKHAGVPGVVAQKLKALGRENRELKQANEIPRKASAYFAHAELDRPFMR